MKESLLFVVIAAANTYLSGVTPGFGLQKKELGGDYFDELNPAKALKNISRRGQAWLRNQAGSARCGAASAAPSSAGAAKKNSSPTN